MANIRFTVHFIRYIGNKILVEYSGIRYLFPLDVVTIDDNGCSVHLDNLKERYRYDD
jgi:hypothetical protein